MEEKHAEEAAKDESPERLSTTVSTSNSPLTMPACESPRKSHNHHSPPLPPLNGEGKLQIPKRRRLEPDTIGSSPVDRRTSLVANSSVITPHKNRSVSTPTRLLHKRTPSLADKPIPVLSPPSPALSTESSVSKTPNSADSDSGDAGILTAGSSASSSENNNDTNRQKKFRSVTSPLHHKVDEESAEKTSLMDLKTESKKLDHEIRKWRQLVDLANKAEKYEIEDQKKDIHKLINEWRSAARIAANHLYNETAVKVDALGGVEELKKQMQTSAPFGDDFDINALSKEDKEAYDALKEEYEQEREESQPQKDDREFTMEYMLTLLNVDHKLLFPDEADQDPQSQG